MFLRHILTNLSDSRTLFFLPLVLAVGLLPWLREELRPLRAVSAFFLMVSVPPLVDIVAIYPRDHYAILLVPVLILLAVQLAKPLLRERPPVPWVLAAGFALIWFLTFHRQHQTAPGSALTGERLNLRRVQCARSVDQAAVSPNSAILDAAQIPAIYLVHPRTSVGGADPACLDLGRCGFSDAILGDADATGRILARRYGLYGAPVPR